MFCALNVLEAGAIGLKVKLVNDDGNDNVQLGLGRFYRDLKRFEPERWMVRDAGMKADGT
ncbi:hypothetical protein QQS21_002300 [Conoideocrella luteorostrata]|uniref:Uncharacterized protein n=1 Tax=Conoideocrella luteorostrata TaxID=1105319 RepID=A0AAJ0CWH1_9HYPO|nr:hypothetical protein QQS21_002300 [Conoideocrella luteorostrata]